MGVHKSLLRSNLINIAEQLKSIIYSTQKLMKIITAQNYILPRYRNIRLVSRSIKEIDLLSHRYRVIILKVNKIQTVLKTGYR